MKKFNKLISIKTKILNLKINKDCDYIALILAIIGYCLAVYSVIIFFKASDIMGKLLCAGAWLTCSIISKNLFEKVRKK